MRASQSTPTPPTHTRIRLCTYIHIIHTSQPPTPSTQRTQKNDRWILRQQEKAQGGKSARQQDILDKILGGVGEKEWGPAAVRQLRDEVCCDVCVVDGCVYGICVYDAGADFVCVLYTAFDISLSD